jgi:hypothetical protein
MGSPAVKVFDRFDRRIKPYVTGVKGGRNQR